MTVTSPCVNGLSVSGEGGGAAGGTRWHAAPVVLLYVRLTSLTQRKRLALQSCDQRGGGKGGIEKGVRSMEEG